MSWQQEYAQKYEQYLHKNWTPDGGRKTFRQMVEDGIAKMPPLISRSMAKMVDEVPKLMWSVDEIAEQTGLSKQFLRSEIRLGHLPVRRFRRRVLVATEDFDHYLETGSPGNKK